MFRTFSSSSAGIQCGPSTIIDRAMVVFGVVVSVVLVLLLGLSHLIERPVGFVH